MADMALVETEEDLDVPESGADEKASENPLEEYVGMLAEISNQEINGWCDRITEIDRKRKKLNDEAAEVREEAKSRGISSTDFNAIVGRFKQDPIKRRMRDAALARGIAAMNEQKDFGF